MRIAYHFVVPEPPQPELDGAVQEAIALRQRFGGSVNFLYPGRTFRSFISPSLAGLDRLTFLRSVDREVDLHHVFLDRLRPLPFTRWLDKPWIATVLTSPGKYPKNLPVPLSHARALVVPSGTENHYLKQSNGPRLEAIRPGIDLAAFSPASPPPPTGSFNLLAASAPWTLRQFRTKGFDALLAAARAIPQLEITFLWRGLFAEEARKAIAAHRLQARAKIVDRKIDVSACLKSMHAAVALAQHPHLLKAYPHSLLEALAARRPVITSSCLAVSRLVATATCGVVVDQLSEEALTAALKILIDNYTAFRDNTQRVDMGVFSTETFLASYEAIYSRALNEQLHSR